MTRNMDSVHRAPNNLDDSEVHIVVDLSNQVPESCNIGVRRNGVAGQTSNSNKRQLGFDLNGPALQEFEYPGTPVPVMDGVPVDDAPVEDFTGSNFEATFDGYIDWGRGSIDVAPDGRLAYYESSPTTVPECNDGCRGFDLNAAVQEAQDQDEAFYEGRLEGLRTGGDFQVDDQYLDFEFDTPVEEQYVPLWFH